MLASLALGGCDALGVRTFAGTIMQLTLTGATPLPADQHLELWARDRYDSILRLAPFTDQNAGKTSPGLMIRKAISADDPCVVDHAGHRLTSASAYPTSVTVAGVVQTPAQQAQQVVDRIAQLTSVADGGRQPATLYAVLPFDPTPPPAVPEGATPDERKTACDAYRGAALAYVPNPAQVTAPLHGLVYGFVAYSTTVPPANYDGVRLDLPVNLDGVRELFFTVEGGHVDAAARGPLYLTSVTTPGGREVIHFDLVGMGGVSGTAALYTNLDQDPVQF